VSRGSKRANSSAGYPGFDPSITRRDFMGGLLLGAGGTLLGSRSFSASHSSMPAAQVGPNWYGYGGVGDYAPSHGNTPELVNAAHGVRDGLYARPAESWIDTSEIFDVVVVGAGIAGLGAAYEFTQRAPAEKTCLILDNHPVFGGESKRNEMIVDGVRLIGPQGANGFSIPDLSGEISGDYASGDARYYAGLGLPKEYSYPVRPDAELEFGKDNYGFLYWLQDQVSVGHFHRNDADGGYGDPVIDPWRNGLKDTRYPESIKAALNEWMNTRARPYTGEELRRWLDTMTYQQYLEQQLGLPAEVSDYAHPILASAVGLGADVVSAYAAFAIGLPGFRGYEEMVVTNRHSFPGGNDGFTRHFVKHIRPDAIAGGDGFEDILNGRIQFDRLDDADARIRMRLGATVVHVTHDAEPAKSRHVWISYAQGDRVYRVKARAVVMAGGGWMNRHVVNDLPTAHREAYASFHHAPVMVANVALRNWRFLARAGITACRYDGEFGFSCNIRQPMWVGDYRPPLDPDKPSLLTFYVPFIYPGRSLTEQGILGRTELLATSFDTYEQRIQQQLSALFGRFGFEPRRDVAGLILNRWGHAYVVPQPGFFFGRDGQPAPPEVISQSYGRVAFGHSELRGNQHWGPAADEGARALKQIMEAVT
jgi:spermidine dehydrogenase